MPDGADNGNLKSGIEPPRTKESVAKLNHQFRSVRNFTEPFKWNIFVLQGFDGRRCPERPEPVVPVSTLLVVRRICGGAKKAHSH